MTQKMPRRRLGADGPEVGAIGLGCMSFGGIFGATDDDTSLACLDAALAAGIDHWDTSNIYGMGVCETIMGRYIAETRPEVTLATKVGIINGPPRRFDNSADHIRSELEGSLERLQVDSVALYYIHRREQERPVEEVIETMAGLIDEGLIGGYGLSEVSPATLRRAHAVYPCRAVQNEYSLWTRLPELGLLQLCQDLGTAFVPFSPLARGMFGDPPITLDTMAAKDWRRGLPRFEEPNFSANTAIIGEFRDFCTAKGWTLSAASLAWMLQKWPHVLPIPGTRTAAHLADWCGAADIAFSDDDWAEIDRMLPVGFAHGDRYNDEQAIAVERYC